MPGIILALSYHPAQERVCYPFRNVSDADESGKM